MMTCSSYEKECEKWMGNDKDQKPGYLTLYMHREHAFLP